MKLPVLSILTVNFGSSAKIANLWRSLCDFGPGVEWEWVIVDNPTKKGEDGRVLEKMFADEKRVHVIQMAENLGYGGGNNEGARFCQGEILAILNPDILVGEGTLNKLLAELENEKDVGIVVPVLKTEKEQILENCRKFPTFWGLMKRRLLGSDPLEKTPIKGTREVEWVQGSFWMLRRELFEKLNGFDERFFLFLEDTDFCRRVGQQKKKILQVCEAIAIHSPNRLSGGNVFKSLARKTFWIHLVSAVKYFSKWRKTK